ncbi:transcriptional regulator ATRX homolog isoform X2 [Halictus rubicundus]|uniref:transcriptional regulator ATRX homolog isoform X2 n=1 Tax=Halictus rubicundus TaxID=77578 RepID=UPI0040359FC9
MSSSSDLINLDRLQRNTRKASDSSLSSTFKKSKPTTETEDTLLDHLRKVENGELAENTEEDTVAHTENMSMISPCGIQTNEELMEEADRVTKNILLNSDASDIENQNNVASSNGSSDEEKKTEKTKSGSDATKSSQKAEKKDSASDEDAEEKREKSGWKRNKLLTMNFSTSDSEVESAKWNKKQEKLKKKAEENEAKNSDADDSIIKRKRRPRRKILDSDSDIQMVDSDSDSCKSVTLASGQSSNTDSDNGKKQKKSLKRKTRRSSDTDSSLGGKKVKQRKRIKKVDTDSDDDSDDDAANSQGTPGKKGRKNIRKVLKDKQVADDTKQAAKEEEERLKRIEDRQKLYNEMYEARLASEEKVDKLVLDFNTETKEDLVSVHPDIVKRLKPHQAKGIKFMWDACFESLERIKSTSGTGCIIAHCMGLGKSLQVIALSHTLLNYEETGIKRIMIVCPLSTVLNWYNEFNLWLKDVEDTDIDVYELTKLKKNVERKFQLQNWHRDGGVLLIGYEMFRNLSGTNNKMRKAMKEEMLRYLIDPGPDLIVCDEGHLLKNEDTALSKSMRRIKTLRRIILTGTPLQNNLIEYHCMVQFVKPNLLGTKKEFLNRFANPINNGQYDDSTEYDVKLMKKRAYVLHKMLKGCVQRFDYSVLTPFLPPKQEYVIFVRLSDVQIKMYRYYLDNLARRQRSANGSLFADFQTLQRIWTHPVVLRLNSERVEKMNEKKFSSDSEGSLRDFINDDSDSNSDTTTSSSSDENDADSGQSNSAPKISRCTRSTQPDIEPIPKPEETEKKDEDWWAQFIEADHFEDMSVSSKLMLLFGILKECEQIGDKVLVFSQSLYSLTLIEKFLGKIDDETQKSDDSEYMGHRSSWSLGLDYFRLDGQTSPENRSIWCRIFNSPRNTRARLFLISTRAGGLGINLTAANRVIIFDASWNPSYDVQSIFRVYRFGQKKPCYVYRFLAAGTMEEKIYNRQVTKLSLSCRVVDEQQIERHYRNNDLNELYTFEANTEGERPTLNLPKDRLLAEIFLKYKDYVENYHEHDSLLENKAEEELNEEERKQAWLEYEEEKKGKPVVMYTGGVSYPNNGMLNQFNNVSPWLNVNNDYEKLQELIRKDYPNATPETQKMMTARVLTDMYTYWERQAFRGTSDTLRTTQVPNIVRMPSMVRNINNTSGQDKRTEIPFSFVDSSSADPKYGDDDDIVEVTPTTTTTGKNKNQEE